MHVCVWIHIKYQAWIKHMELVSHAKHTGTGLLYTFKHIQYIYMHLTWTHPVVRYALPRRCEVQGTRG
jgi:hypothetical protein